MKNAIIKLLLIILAVGLMMARFAWEDVHAAWQRRRMEASTRQVIELPAG